MQKLIKLLFPKVYTTIFNEGYSLGQLHYSQSGPQDHYQYDEDDRQPLDFWNYPEEE